MQISIKKALAEAASVKLHLRADPLEGYDPAPQVVLLATSRAWLLTRSLDGLDLGGYVAVLRGHVRSLRTTPSDGFRKQILQAEGIWPRAVRVPSVNLTSGATILRSLQKSQHFAIVVNENLEGWRSLHCRIESVTDDRATLLGFNGVGERERRPIQVDITRITQIRFGSRYLKLYQKYALERKSL